ncbi:phage tail protein [Achromobacter seleniivolatilans]|uniref:Phage tail protein n=1 Tax=Achromobacter seleniivolatilans TaxID=3047478 RepID=A0ABY9M9N3_9BURK|nr:phage tail protein [Achromobacter sp. R39]WMD23299.1 phage tail protein [Achromobacter sp. R39]
MALLDALTYIINADNSQLDKAVDNSEKKVDEFGKSLTSAEGRAKLMEDKIKGSFARIGGVIFAAVAASKALSAAVERAQFVEQVRQVGESAGVAVGDVDALGKSVELLGGDAQGAQASLEGLAKSSYDALQDVNSSQAKAFGALKVSLKGADGQIKSTMQLMGDLAGAIQGKDRRKAEDMLSGVGITDRKTIDLLFKGRQELDSLMRAQKQQGVVTQDSVERAQRYTVAMAGLKQTSGSVRDSISDTLLPALTWVIEKFDAVIKWVRAHEQFVKGFFIGLAGVLAVVFTPAVWAAAVAVWALIAPFLAVALPIVAVIALFALLYDDVMNFLDGNDSLIGQISEKYPIVGETVKAMAEAVKAAFKWIVEAIGTAWEAIKGFPKKAIDAFAAMGASISNIFDAIVKVVKNAWAYVGSVFDSVSSVIKKIGKWLGFGGGDDIQVNATTVSRGVSDAEAKADQNMKAAQEQLNQAAANPVNSVTSNAISNASNTRTETNVQVGQVTVQTQATDAQGISQSIGGELKGELKNLQADSASGVNR